MTGNRASFGIELSVRQDGIGADPIAQEDIRRLLGLVFGPPT